MSHFDTVLASLKDLADAEQAYRHAYTQLGADDIRTRRAWDAMNLAGARARVLHRAHTCGAQTADARSA